jgi:hypothetical protein
VPYKEFEMQGTKREGNSMKFLVKVSYLNGRLRKSGKGKGTGTGTKKQNREHLQSQFFLPSFMPLPLPLPGFFCIYFGPILHNPKVR